MHDAANIDYWSQRWRDGRTGWHRSDVNPWLSQHGAALRGPVLVPLAGRTVDLAWLCERHSEVFAIEAIAEPIEDWFAAHDLKPETSSLGPFTEHRARGHQLRFLQGDVFSLPEAHLPQLGAIWDRAALFALPAPERARYAEQMRALIEGGAELLLVTLEYEQMKVDGPPFAVLPNELERHFAGLSLDLLGTQDLIEQSEKHRAAGCEQVLERAWRIRA